MTIETPSSTLPTVDVPRAGGIPALSALLAELADRPVRFCLWKSNIRLAEGLSGTTDLDLLVDRTHAPRFREILARRGVRPLTPAPGAAHPGIEHYLGMDPGDGRLFHLHVHYQLVLGEHHVKNYRIPLEDALLGSARLLDGVPVPPAALELAILASRALLKYRARDVVKDVAGVRSPGVPLAIQAEIAWLLQQTSVPEVRERLQATGAVLPPEIVCTFLETVLRDPRDGRALLRLRGRLRQALRPHQRHSRLHATLAYHRIERQRRRLARRHPSRIRMTPATGGVMVALVGADGAGKSTVVAEVARWLAWKLRVRVFYLGSKQPSRRSRALYVAFRALRRGTRIAEAAPGSVAARPLAAARDGALALHRLSIGRDRSRRAREARREVLDGAVAVCDRYPLEALSSDPAHRVLDGPQLATTLHPGRRSAARLAAVEERTYRSFRLPDVLVVLEVDADVAARRKPDHQPAVLAAKSTAATALAALAEARGVPVRLVRVDANRPLEDVLRDVKTGLWDAI